MEGSKKDKWDYINDIVGLELEMFLVVNAREGAECIEKPETFKLMRWMSHSVLSEETLLSYLDDLKTAKAAGRNLMTEKYARMENLIPPLKTDRRIFEIAATELAWMRKLKEKYPHVISGKPASEDYFINYMCSEYETYSDKTLGMLLEDVRKALNLGKNIVEMRYLNLFKRLGYDSLDAAEAEYGRLECKDVPSC